MSNNMTAFADSGKVHMDLFNQLIYPYHGAPNNNLIAGPGYGVDVALVQLPGNYTMALTSDPLSWIPTLGLQESAWLSVHLMANDIATTSQPPQFAQLVLNLPESCTSSEFEAYWMHVHQYCKEIGVAITGGHTGKAAGMQATLAGGGTMITVAKTDDLLLSKFAQPGDFIVVTKEAAQIASSILALSFPDLVRSKCGQENWQQAASLFYETSSLQAGLCAGAVNKMQNSKAVTSMHDVTEGGILGAIYEMAMASGCGAFLHEDQLPIGEAQQAVCGLFGIDPYSCVGAGSMIMAVKPGREEQLLLTLQQNNIKATLVGQFTAKAEGIRMQKKDELASLGQPGADPYWNAFFHALKNGWK